MYIIGERTALFLAFTSLVELVRLYIVLFFSESISRLARVFRWPENPGSGSLW